MKKSIFVTAGLIFVSAIVMSLIIGGMLASAKDASLPPPQTTKVQPSNDELYPYRSGRFTFFVDESYSIHGSGKAGDFYNWLEMAYSSGKFKYPGKENLTLPQLIKAEKKELKSIKDLGKLAQAQMDVAKWTHRMIKKTITHFSLDRGFEFFNTVQYGERQCFLQSVLISGILQGMGMDAGVEMVFKNPEGALSNNGHAIVLLKLPSSRDIIVDASEPQPFPKHKGLFVKAADYTYVTPEYVPDSSKILFYAAAGDGHKIATGQVRTLGFSYLRSQFYYYRGERVPGGLLAPKKTGAGLALSEKYLSTAVKLCPQNPLAVFGLGWTYIQENNNLRARIYMDQCYNLYKRYGWMPGDTPKFRDMTRR